MSCNNVQILNFNHNIVEIGSDNKLIITDNVKCNSITIPQPITNTLQINSPGPQGLQGPSGSQGPIGPSGSQGPIGPQGPAANTGSFATTGSNTFRGNQNISGSVTITGSLTVSGSSTFTNIGPAIFSGSVVSTEGFTGSFTGSFSGDGSNLTNLPSQVGGNTGEIQYKTNGDFGGVSALTFNGTTVTATNISATGSFSGSLSGSFNGLSAEYVLTVNLGDPGPSTPPYSIDLIIIQGGTYIISRVYTNLAGYIYFPDPVLCLGQRITIQNRDNTNSADISDNGYLPRDIANSEIATIGVQTTKTFIAAEIGPSGQIKWLEI